MLQRATHVISTVISAVELFATFMFPSAVAVDMEEYQAHQRNIVRHFAPHLSNSVLKVQERVYFALCLARIVLVLVLPSCAVFYLHDSFIETPVFALVCVACVIELVLTMVRVCYGHGSVCGHSVCGVLLTAHVVSLCWTASVLRAVAGRLAHALELLARGTALLSYGINNTSSVTVICANNC